MDKNKNKFTEELHFQNILNLLKEKNIDSILYNLSNLKRLNLDDLIEETLHILVSNNLTNIDNLDKIFSFLKDNNYSYKSQLLNVNENFLYIVSNNHPYSRSVLFLFELCLENKLSINEACINKLRPSYSNNKLTKKFKQLEQENGELLNSIEEKNNIPVKKFTM